MACIVLFLSSASKTIASVFPSCDDSWLQSFETQVTSRDAKETSANETNAKETNAKEISANKISDGSKWSAKVTRVENKRQWTRWTLTLSTRLWMNFHSRHLSYRPIQVSRHLVRHRRQQCRHKNIKITYNLSIRHAMLISLQIFCYSWLELPPILKLCSSFFQTSCTQTPAIIICCSI